MLDYIGEYMEITRTKEDVLMEEIAILTTELAQANKKLKQEEECRRNREATIVRYDVYRTYARENIKRLERANIVLTVAVIVQIVAMHII